MTAATPEQQTVRFLFDPSCPWTWRTSRWIEQVRTQRSLDVQWQLYSLEYVNRAQPDSPYMAALRATRVALRLLELARIMAGNAAMGRLYTAIGTARHEQGRDISDPEVLREALSGSELDPALLDRALRETDVDAALERSYAEIAATKAIGVPTLFFEEDGSPFYGPVISAVPHGPDAVSLWDDVRKLAAHPYFFELKRPR